MAIEIEIKIKISNDNMQKLERWLESNAKFIRTEKHFERYLENPGKPFSYINDEGIIDSKEYLRIRETENSITVCFKKWHIDPERPGHHTHCDEYEFSVSDAQSARLLFDSLGYTKDTAIINKTRNTYMTDEFEIVIDDVENLGIFVELELKKEVDDVKEGHRMINELLKEIGITEFTYMNRGYVSLMWNPDYDFGDDIAL